MSCCRRLAWCFGGLLAVLGARVGDARACGCFTPPNPTVSVVQAGERILFAQKDGVVTAHIQIQFAGSAEEFGWLLPLPTVPALQVGTDELFLQLIGRTQPTYSLSRQFDGQCFPGGVDAGASGAPDAAPSAGGGPVVVQDSIGPYDYAVLHADNQDEMLGWLAANHYYVPVGTDDVVKPYVRPGAYFLALKLRSGKSLGDLQPVVVTYASDLPMIPLVLTSVTANPDMGIQVWMLGKGRAIPRNYYHTVLDDCLIDWLNGGRNYNDLVIRATMEAPGPRHTFITEYAGSSSVMSGALDYGGRFGSPQQLAAQPSPIAFVDYLRLNGYLYANFVFPSQLIAILGQYIPLPPALAAKGFTAAQFYFNIDYYLGQYRHDNPQDFVGYTIDYRPQVIAQEIDDRIIQPTVAAAKLFDQYPYLTRLYTTLSPENMNRDPVFSFNAGLPDVSNLHSAVLTYRCGGDGKPLDRVPATLVTDSGWTLDYPNGTGESFRGADKLPASRRIEVLTEEANPAVLVDNSAAIAAYLRGTTPPPLLVDAGMPAEVAAGGGCSLAMGRSGTGWALLAGLALLVRRRPRGGTSSCRRAAR